MRRTSGGERGGMRAAIATPPAIASTVAASLKPGLGAARPARKSSRQIAPAPAVNIPRRILVPIGPRPARRGGSTLLRPVERGIGGMLVVRALPRSRYFYGVFAARRALSGHEGEASLAPTDGSTRRGMARRCGGRVQRPIRPRSMLGRRRAPRSEDQGA
jgi:hypothetical protein